MRRPVDELAKPLSRPSEDALEAIHQIMHLYRTQQYRVLRDQPEAITHLEGKVLGFFTRHPGATQSDLVAHSGRDKGQLAKLIGGLKERGLLEARQDESDRRSQRLHPTPAGQAADQALRRQARKLAGVAVAGFSVQEKAQLSQLLQRLRGNLERHEAAD